VTVQDWCWLGGDWKKNVNLLLLAFEPMCGLTFVVEGLVARDFDTELDTGFILSRSAPQGQMDVVPCRSDRGVSVAIGSVKAAPIAGVYPVFLQSAQYVYPDI